MTRKSFQGMFVLCLLLTVTFGCAAAMAQGDTITTQEQGEVCFKQARQHLAGLGMTIPREILLKVRPIDEVQVHYVSGGGRAIEVGGYYQAFNPETIWVPINLPKDQTIAIMSHELAHAWQSTNCPLQDRTLTEGFATWCEYKVLLAMGHQRYAARLAADDDPDYGGGLRLFLEVEKKYGAKGVFEFAKKNTKVPKTI